MRLCLIASIEIPDPLPPETPAEIAPDAPKPPPGGFDITKAAGAIDKTLQGLSAQFGEVGLVCLSAKVEALVPDNPGLPPIDSWNTLAQIYGSLLCKHIPGLPGLVMISAYADDADLRKAQIISVKGGSNQKDGLAYRLDVLKSLTNSTNTVMHSTVKALEPALQIAKQVVTMQSEDKAAPVQEPPGEPKTA